MWCGSGEFDGVVVYYWGDFVRWVVGDMGFVLDYCWIYGYVWVFVCGYLSGIS